MSPEEETDAINHADAMDRDEEARQRQDAGAQAANDASIEATPMREGDWIRIRKENNLGDDDTFIDEISNLTTDGAIHTKGGEVTWPHEIEELRSATYGSRFPFPNNVEDHQPDCMIRTSRDGWDADCTCVASES